MCDSAGFFLGLFFYAEGRGDTFLRNLSLSPYNQKASLSPFIINITTILLFPNSSPYLSLKVLLSIYCDYFCSFYLWFI